MTHKKTIKKRFENQINFWLKLQIQKENIFCTVSNFLQRHRLKNCIRIKNKRKMLKNPFHFVNKPNGSQVKMVNDPDYPLKLNHQTVINRRKTRGITSGKTIEKGRTSNKLAPFWTPGSIEIARLAPLPQTFIDRQVIGDVHVI